MPARGWWWQRIHPALRIVLFLAYFGGAIALIVVPLTLALEDFEPSATSVSGIDLSDDQLAEPKSTEESAAIDEEPPPAPSGGELYENRCSSCHGPSLEGGTGPELGRGSDAAEENDNRVLLRIRDGKNDMPGFSGTLSEDEIDLVLAFLREQQSG